MVNFIFIDKKFKKNTYKYIGQCFLASLTILAILFFLDILNETAIISSLGASVFIVFTMPTQYSSDPRRLIGGYFVGLTVGFIFFIISSSSFMNDLISYHTTIFVIFGSMAVGFSIFIMAVTNTEHAPAAGIALGLVINSWDGLTILYILVALFWMISIKLLLRKYLMDLISPHESPPIEHKR